MSRIAWYTAVGATVALALVLSLTTIVWASDSQASQAPGFELTWADANCRDGIDATDSLVVLRADAGFNSSQEDPCVIMTDTATFDGVERIWGDFDCSGLMSAVDSLKILQFDAGFQPSQTGDCPDFGSTVTAS